jgi:hypothetical protein
LRRSKRINLAEASDKNDFSRSIFLFCLGKEALKRQQRLSAYVVLDPFRVSSRYGRRGVVGLLAPLIADEGRFCAATKTPEKARKSKKGSLVCRRDI